MNFVDLLRKLDREERIIWWLNWVCISLQAAIVVGLLFELVNK